LGCGLDAKRESIMALLGAPDASPLEFPDLLMHTEAEPNSDPNTAIAHAVVERRRRTSSRQRRSPNTSSSKLNVDNVAVAADVADMKHNQKAPKDRGQSGKSKKNSGHQPASRGRANNREDAIDNELTIPSHVQVEGPPMMISSDNQEEVSVFQSDDEGARDEASSCSEGERDKKSKRKKNADDLLDELLDDDNDEVENEATARAAMIRENKKRIEDRVAAMKSRHAHQGPVSSPLPPVVITTPNYFAAGTPTESPRSSSRDVTKPAPISPKDHRHHHLLHPPTIFPHDSPLQKSLLSHGTSATGVTTSSEYSTDGRNGTLNHRDIGMDEFERYEQEAESVLNQRRQSDQGSSSSSSSNNTARLLGKAHDRLMQQALKEEVQSLKDQLASKTESIELLAGQLRRAMATKCDLVISHTELERHHEQSLQSNQQKFEQMKRQNMSLLESKLTGVPPAFALECVVLLTAHLFRRPLTLHFSASRN
jgi:hypothetical protein